MNTPGPPLPRRTLLKVGGVLTGAAVLSRGMTDPSPGNTDGNQPGLDWPAGQALPMFAPPQHLNVVNLSSSSPEEQLLFNTLQGIVARNRPALCGTIDYDPAVPDTINLAITLAGVRGSVVADPDLAGLLAKPPYKLPPLVDLRGRFASKIGAYTWQFRTLWPQCTHRLLFGLVPYLVEEVTRSSAYGQVLIQATHVHDSSNRTVRTADLSSFAGQGPKYLRFADSFPDEGCRPQLYHLSLSADGSTVADFTPTTAAEEPYLSDSANSSALIAPQMSPATVRFGDNTQYRVYKLTPPADAKTLTVSVDIANQFAVYATTVPQPNSVTSHPFAHVADYQVATGAMSFSLDPNQESERALFEGIAAAVDPNTPYLGWFSEGVGGEWGGVGLLSTHSVYVLADDWSTNQTVHAGIRPRPRRSPSASPPELENKIYLTFCVSDGDNLQFNENRMQQLWDDPGRGKVPITWTIQPHLAEAMPDILDYYQRTATVNDCFMTGASGAGYVVPIQWPDDTFPLYANMTHDLMEQLGISTVSAINYQSWASGNLPLSGAKAADYSQIVRPLGIACPSNAPQLITLPGATPESALSGAGDPASMEAIIADLSYGWDSSSPAFFALQPAGWTMTLTDIATVVERLDARYKVVRADQFFQLICTAHPAIWHPR